MKQITRLTMTLALLIMAVTGAWAQNDEPTVTWDPATKTGTFTMPANNIELQVEYYAESNLFLSKEALADKANIAVTAGETTVEFDDDGKSANTITEGTAMTVTYNGTKKVLGFKAEKKAEKTITIGEQNYTVLDGETWSQFITRNQLSSWSVKSANLNTYCVSMDGGSAMFTLFVSSDGNNWEPFEFSPQDAPIDTDKQYIWH